MGGLGSSTQTIDTSRELTATQESNALRDMGARWWYNYLPTAQDTVPENGAVFVPNFFKGSYVTAPNLAAAAAYPSRCILTSNEPYNPSPQANESVNTVLAYWHQLELTGCRLGAPSGGKGTGWDAWIAAFMAGTVPETGLPPRVDFMVMHEYQSIGNSAPVAAANVINNLRAVYALYGKPIWLTEFAKASFGSPNLWPTQAEEQAFLAALIPPLRTLTFVEKYASYPLTLSASQIIADPNEVNIMLANADGTLTVVGQTYRDYGAHP
jgi:hypothetical protein